MKRQRSTASLALAALTLLLTAGPAHGEITQPDGQQMPLEAIGDANYIGDNDTDFGMLFVGLESLFSYRGENIDWFADASAQPGVFSPVCDFSGQMVLRGGGCLLDLAWYNAVESGGAVPADEELYTLVPKESLVGEYFPMVGDPPQQTFSAADIRNDPNYAGGMIGFAVRGGAGNCTQTKFSQAELNLVCSGCATPGPWVSALIWQSTAKPDAFYIGFEDLPSSESSFTAGGQFKNDGDFNDFLYFVTGVACEGGGDACTTDEPGQCAVGRTTCGGDGCRRTLGPSAEVCDNVDNDCNGKVDDEAPCADGLVCAEGSCVAPCSTGEFPCADAYTCVDGLCVETSCLDVECDAGQICRDGECGDACSGVSCPEGQDCQLGRCRDLCAGIECENGAVCDKGVCVSPCSCKACPAGKQCQDDGRCLDMACMDVVCDSGLVCLDGECVDPCDGVVCPGGAACVNGFCEEPEGGEPSGSGGGITIGSGGTSSTPDPNPGSGADSNGEPGVGRNVENDAGCACRTSHRGSPWGAALASAFMLALATRRRRSTA